LRRLTKNKRFYYKFPIY